MNHERDQDHLGGPVATDSAQPRATPAILKRAPSGRAPAAGRRWRRLATALVVGLILAAGSLHWLGRQLTAPTPRQVGLPPDDFPAQVVHVASDSGSLLAGWLHEADQPVAAALLLHPLRGDRSVMLGRARLLAAHGYHVLCLDFQAHGESPGQRITMGHLEAMDAAAGVGELRRRYPGLPVVAVGCSLGGAAVLLADHQQPPDALVLEAVFADVTNAIRHRLQMRLGRPGRWLSPLLTLQMKWFLDVDPADLRPSDRMTQVSSPVLLIYGEEDRHAPADDGEALRANVAAGVPLEWWLVPAAGHVDFLRHDPDEYQQRVLGFLSRHLAPAVPPGPP